ncbi:putative membrane protein [Pseudooceanicola batsensis HTCC2597]|uniref:Putative membrane protein n=1 Tax=Pseudooceanicola batsensis (strain ATCC BAA-863 / DSM 15984 / KCTC 12145 / HTCC2597) TaxID=252305 RepID=A3U0W5_PSEBH|nr:membrane protein [Pseudooceanicola batsensis]EAQ02406.1 putative membrane protein [Pseudooceanicola batsensis HTCC2597]
MTRAAGWLAAALPLFLALLLWLGWTEAQGFTSADVTELWAKAIVQIDGPGQFTASDAFYPPLPYALTLALQSLPGDHAVPVPFLLSAALGAMILLLWFDNLRQMGTFRVGASLFATALLGLNPFFLRALADGPETMLTILGTWLFARGIVHLRLTGNAPDMMKVAVGLMIVALSDSYGLLISLGALPFLIVAARPSMIAASSTGYLFAMFYPVAAAVGSLFFVSMIFNSALVPQLLETPEAVPLTEHLMILSGLVPVALVAALRNLPTPGLFMPLIAAAGTVGGAYALNLGLNVEGDPLIAIAPMLGVVVTGLRFWPSGALRVPVVIALLAFGLAQSVLVMRTTAVQETRAWALAVAGRGTGADGPTQEAAAFLSGRSGILLDVERNPGMVTALGDIGGLVIAGQPAYDWALEGGLPQTRYILVPQVAEGRAVSDRVLRRFPSLARNRLSGYNEIYENGRWRVFEKTEL